MNVSFESLKKIGHTISNCLCALWTQVSRWHLLTPYELPGSPGSCMWPRHQSGRPQDAPVGCHCPVTASLFPTGEQGHTDRGRARGSASGVGPAPPCCLAHLRDRGPWQSRLPLNLLETPPPRGPAPQNELPPGRDLTPGVPAGVFAS